MAQFLSKSSKKTLDIIVPLGVAGYFFYSNYKGGKGKVQEAGIASLIILVIGYIIVSQVTRAFCEDCTTT